MDGTEPSNVLGADVKAGSVWNTVEFPALKVNPNVTKIIQVDPVSLKELIIFSR
jgi:hypothetical protein